MAPETASASSPAEVSDEKAWGPTMIMREKQLEDALVAAREEIAFLRTVVQALVERRGPVRVP